MMITVESAKDYIPPKESPEKYEARFQDILSRIPEVPEGQDASSLDETDLQQAKEDLLEKYKGGLEQEVEFIFSVVEQLRAQREISRLKAASDGKNEEEIDRIKLNLTETLFFESAFLLANRRDEDYLRSLIDATYQIAWRFRETSEWRALHKGLLGEVGLYRLLEKRGLSPTLPYPRQDARRHIDMWADAYMSVGRQNIPIRLAIQVKHTSFAQKPHFLQLEEDIDAWASAELKRLAEKENSEAGIVRFSELAEKLKKDFGEMQEDCRQRNAKSLGDRTKKQIEPAVVIFPEGSRDNPCINFYTGEPNEKYFKDFEMKLE
jgi:hypothetical protein